MFRYGREGIIKEMNTLCPRIGVRQWTCNSEECVCHLKADIKRREQEREHGKGIDFNSVTDLHFNSVLGRWE